MDSTLEPGVMTSMNAIVTQQSVGTMPIVSTQTEALCAFVLMDLL